MKLDGFLLEFGALVRVDAEFVILSPVFVAMFFEAQQEVVKQGGVAERAFAVRAELGVHLQQTEVNAHLQLL